MTIPTIHLNGTSRRELLDQIFAVRSTLRAALDKMHAAQPHGRDYYPQGPDAYKKAHAESMDRIMRVSAVAAEFDALVSALLESGDRVDRVPPEADATSNGLFDIP